MSVIRAMRDPFSDMLTIAQADARHDCVTITQTLSGEVEGELQFTIQELDAVINLLSKLRSDLKEFHLIP